MKRQKGITLIALVITIIVLLILAGVSISLVVGQNGILSNAQNSVTADAKAKEEESIKTSALAAISISSSKGNIALENGYFNQELKNEFGEGNYLLEEQEDKFIVTIVGTGNSYEVDKFGNVSGQVSPEGGVGGEEGENVSDDGYEGIYPEADTVPTDTTIFTYDIISEEAKTIAITGIKSEYESVYYYNRLSSYDEIPDDKKTEIIIPYEIDGYSVKEVRYLTRKASDQYNPLNTIANIQLPKGLEIIGEEAFSGCVALTTISIPNTVTTIGTKAFYRCSGLTSIVIPDYITIIGGQAFAESALTNVTISTNITTGGVFYSCGALTNVTIADNVTEIVNGTFTNCDSLTNIIVEDGNDAYVDIDGVLYNKDKTTLLCYPEGRTDTAYTILDGVTTIGDTAFYSCNNLTNVIIPDGVTTIGSFCFGWSQKLANITIPDSVATIGDLAFYYCNKLTTVNYKGTQEQWESITIGTDNTCLTNATLVPNYTGE